MRYTMTRERAPRLFSAGSRRISAFDGLRAVAVLLVVMFHAKVPGFRGGFIGVDVFFTLSGFLITGLLLAEREKTGSIHLGHFYLRRALRLVPALWAMVLFWLVVASVLHERARFASDLLDAATAVTYVSNWTRAWGNFTYLFPHSWSLSIEEQFYLVWGAVLLGVAGRVSRGRLVGLLAATIVLVMLRRWSLQLEGARVDRLYAGFDTRADQLLIGCAGAALVSMRNVAERLQNIFARVRAIGFGAAGMLALLISRVSWDHSPFLYRWGVPLIAVLSLAIILEMYVNESGALARLLSQRMLAYIGMISYGIYLWHFPTMRVLNEHIFRGVPHQWAYQAVFGGGLAILAAAVSYRYLEQPLLALKDRLQPVRSLGLAPKDTPPATARPPVPTGNVELVTGGTGPETRWAVSPAPPTASR